MVSAVLVALAGGFTVAASAGQPTAPGANKLQCFDGTTDTDQYYEPHHIDQIYGGHCSQPNSGAKGSAILDLSAPDTARDGDYAGVYVLSSTLNGAKVSSITQLGYQYTGTKTPTPGELSLNLPIDTDGDATTTENYAYIDAAYCPGVSGVVDAIADPTCGVTYANQQFANWAAFVQYAGSSAAVSNDFAFVVAERPAADVPQTWTVSNVKLGKGGSLPGKKK